MTRTMGEWKTRKWRSVICFVTRSLRIRSGDESEQLTLGATNRRRLENSVSFVPVLTIERGKERAVVARIRRESDRGLSHSKTWRITTVFDGTMVFARPRNLQPTTFPM